MSTDQHNTQAAQAPACNLCAGCGLVGIGERCLCQFEPATPPSAEAVSREDFDKLSADLTRAKRMLVDLHKIGSNRVRDIIEARTGTWFVWGQDRDAPAPPPSAESGGDAFKLVRKHAIRAFGAWSAVCKGDIDVAKTDEASAAEREFWSALDVLTALAAQPAAPVFDRARETSRRQSAVETLLASGWAWQDGKWSQPAAQQGVPVGYGKWAEGLPPGARLLEYDGLPLVHRNPHPGFDVVLYATPQPAQQAPARDDFNGIKPPMRHISGVNLGVLERAARRSQTAESDPQAPLSITGETQGQQVDGKGGARLSEWQYSLINQGIDMLAEYAAWQSSLGNNSAHMAAMASANEVMRLVASPQAKEGGGNANQG